MVRLSQALNLPVPIYTPGCGERHCESKSILQPGLLNPEACITNRGTTMSPKKKQHSVERPYEKTSVNVWKKRYSHSANSTVLPSSVEQFFFSLASHFHRQVQEPPLCSVLF